MILGVRVTTLLINTMGIINSTLLKISVQQRALNTIGGPGFLTVVWFGSCPTPSPSPVSKLNRPHTGRMRKRDNLLTELPHFSLQKYILLYLRRLFFTLRSVHVTPLSFLNFWSTICTISVRLWRSHSFFFFSWRIWKISFPLFFLTIYLPFFLCEAENSYSCICSSLNRWFYLVIKMRADWSIQVYTRLAMATFWRKLNHDGKISPA